MLRIPDPPVSFTNDVTITTATQIGVTWAQGFCSGGSPIIDYTLSIYDVQLQTFVVVQANIVQTSYTITGLTTGTTYIFKVQSRNSFGLSVYSYEISILAA
jgi:hypothetical protein